MYYEEVIAQCMEVVARAEQPLPKPCGKTKVCRLAGGCQECFAELLKGTAKSREKRLVMDHSAVVTESRRWRSTKSGEKTMNNLGATCVI